MNRFCSLLLVSLLCPLILQGQEWRPLGPYGGAVNQIAVDSTTQSVLMATGSLWLWRLSGGAREWQPLINIFDLPQPGTISALIPATDGVYMLAYTNMIYFSSDGGESWTLQHELDDAQGQRPELVTVGDTLYLKTWKQRLFASGDHGATWVTSDTVTFPMFRFATDGVDLYAIGVNGFYRHRKEGGWENVGPRAGTFAARAWVDGDTLVHWDGATTIQRSADRGVRWESRADSGLADVAYHDGVIWMVNDEGLHTMPLDAEMWTFVAPLQAPPIRSVRLLPHGNDLLISDYYDIRRWDAGTGTLSPLNDGLNAIGTGDLIKEGDTLLVGSAGLNFYSADRGESWEWRHRPLIFGYNQIVRSHGIIYGITQQADSLFISEDWGETWSAWEIDADSLFGPEALYVDESVILAAGRGLFRSTDGGTVWEKVSFKAGLQVRALTGDGDVIFAEIAGMPSQFYRSEDKGVTWDSISSISSSSLGRSFVYEDGVLYYGSRSLGLHRSMNRGDTWEHVDAGFPRGFDGVDSVVMIGSINAYGDTLFVSVIKPMMGTRRLFLSIDGGSNWSEIDVPGGTISLGMIHSDKDGWIASTGDRGLFTTASTLDVTLDEPSLDDGTDAVRLSLDIDGRLSWYRSQPSPFRLDLYTLTGEHIALIADGEANGGMHALPLDDLPAGAYLCVLHSGGESAAVVVTAR